MERAAPGECALRHTARRPRGAAARRVGPPRRSDLDGSLDSAKDTASAILLVAVAAMTAYQSFWKQVGLTQKIEVATSRTPAKVEEQTVTEEVVVPKDTQRTRRSRKK